MKNSSISALYALTFLFFLSCGSSRRTATTEYVVMDTITVSARNNPLDIYRASATRSWDITDTRAALSFNLPERTADGKAWLSLKPYFYSTDSLVLDAKTMRVDSVRITAGDTRVRRFIQRDDKLIVFFERKIHREQLSELYIRYKAMPYAAASGGSAAIRDDRGLYFINTNHEVPHKPVQIWTQGETEANSHWLPTLDQPNERFTVKLELTVPDSFTTLSNGVNTSSKRSGNMRTDVWEMKQPIQPYAIMMAIGKFAVVQDRVAQGKEVSYYVEPAYAPYAKMIFNNTPEMIDYFSKVTGVPYPWNKYSQVVVRDYVSGAMENTTASLFGEFMHQNFREIADKNYEDVVSHELFHQWFGDYVTAESWSNLTVNESFANYGEQLWRKYKYGRSSNDELALNDLNLYLGQVKYNDAHLVRFHYHSREEMFDRISYQKGGAVLRYLHGLIGDSAFYRSMNLYLTKNALQPAEATHWRHAVEEATGGDWNWFFNQWYFRGGHPELDIRHQYDDIEKELRVTVRQTTSDSQQVYQLPLKAALVYGNDKEVFDWRIDGKRKTFTYPYKNGIRPLFIPDHENWLPGTIEEQKPAVQWLAQLRNTDDYINKRKAVGHAFAARKDSASRILLHEALKDTIPGVRAFTLVMLGAIKDRDIHQQFAGEVEMLAMNDPNHRVRAAAFGTLGNWKIKGSSQAMLEAIADSSYMVAGAALKALRKTESDTAYLLAKAAMVNNPKASLEAEAWETIALRGNPADVTIFEKQAPYAYGTRKMILSGAMQSYLINTQDLSSFERGLKLLEGMAANESIKPYRLGVGTVVFAVGKDLRAKEKTEKDAGKADALRQRIRLAGQYQNSIIAAETDPENLKKYKAMIIED